ncbi:hypothetical protein OJF2_28260 [Aquisphaera giovannonii]|uniref:Uncharacterized protein n=1 Tax=Aquisphaera giovannonii TaxID=406548 RepID=A0A5B9W2D6_9BACT|nr:hypothetical protein [Aquisphaera giovannonii]QEH34291.1 hypothetical protein OJF2_28260 [Aquisphaera giovannonii]
MPIEMEASIRQAIVDHNLLRVVSRWREHVVEPYLLYRGEAGFALLAYEIERPSHPSAPPGWVEMRLSCIQVVRPLPEHFEPNRPGYEPGHRRYWGRIICQC